MSLIKCQECGASISDSAKTCPHCGYPLKQKREHKGLSIIVLTALIFTIVMVVFNWSTVDRFVARERYRLKEAKEFREYKENNNPNSSAYIDKDTGLVHLSEEEFYDDLEQWQRDKAEGYSSSSYDTDSQEQVSFDNNDVWIGDKRINSIKLYFNYNYDRCIANTTYYITPSIDTVSFSKTENAFDSDNTIMLGVEKDKTLYNEVVSKYIDVYNLVPFERTKIKDEYGSITYPELENAVMEIAYTDKNSCWSVKMYCIPKDTNELVAYLDSLFEPYEQTYTLTSLGLTRKDIIEAHIGDAWFTLRGGNIESAGLGGIDKGYSDYIFDTIDLENMSLRPLTQYQSSNQNFWIKVIDKTGNEVVYVLESEPTHLTEIYKYLDDILQSGVLEPVQSFPHVPTEEELNAGSMFGK